MADVKVFPPMSEREINGAEISRHAAAEGMVLLKNDNAVLPLASGQTVALFGNGAARTVRGGTGSGDPFNGGLSGGGDANINLSPRYHINVLNAMEDEYTVVSSALLREYAVEYDRARDAQKDHVMSVFAFPEQTLTEEMVKPYCNQTDTALFVISRNSGEGNDRAMTQTVTIDGKTVEIGDYRLAETEKENLRLLRKQFGRLVVILNVAGPISVEDLNETEADAILLMGQAGQEGGKALMDILTGRVTPSGKLTATWAEKYQDYPTSDVFLKDPIQAPYPEGIYVGYRYFDTFDKQPGYPFGYGLSYTTFALDQYQAALDGETLTVSVRVTNTGNYSGKEVVQLYVSAPVTELDMPAKELRGFQKTGCLQPGEQQTVEISVSVRALASYSEQHGGYILSAGSYHVSVGTSSRDTLPVCSLSVPETRCIRTVDVALPLQETLEQLKGWTVRPDEEKWNGVAVLQLEKMPETVDGRSPYADESVVTYTTDASYQPAMPYEKVSVVPKADWKLVDVHNGLVSMEEFVAQLSNAQLADLCCGTGWGVADADHPVVGASSESVPGAAGETTHQMEDTFGIPSIVMADGPGGIRVTQQFEATKLETGEKTTVYHFCTAWPVGTLLAQSFDPEVLEKVGYGMAKDMEALQIALALGPGINIQRDPMCGRNFEYYSEDPLVAGKMAAAMIQGIQSVPGCGGCIKHYAANNQEFNRHMSNSIVGQRALREIYLEPFKIAIEESQPWSIMTSYNLINGVPTADSFDLCTNLARGEWGFEGLIMTDWNGGSSTPWISMHAGNDLIMPGGKSRVLNILEEVETVSPLFDERGQVVMEKEIPFLPAYTARWNSFEPCADGDEQISVGLADGHTAAVVDGKILVDGEPVFVKANGMKEFMKDPQNFNPFYQPLDQEIGTVSDDGHVITYRGRFNSVRRICRGDVQRCAANNLLIIMKSRFVR